MKSPARYSVSFGLSGCYLPDSHGGIYECHTLRELVQMIQENLELYELPKSKLRDIKLRRLWAFIKNNGSSSAHFNIEHKGHCLSFSGLTEDEFNREMELCD